MSQGHEAATCLSDVAVIGMACIFPGAPDLRTYWENILNKIDATGDPPEEWRAELSYDPNSQANDRIYTKRGGYLGDLARFDPLRFGIMPRSIDGGEPDHFLALRVAYEALEDSGYVQRPFNRERTAVIIGRGTYINRGYTTLVQHGMVVDQTLRILKQLHSEYTEGELERIKQELKASLPPFNAETAPGLVPNIVSGRIANRLDLMGPNYTVDAACASSLIAVELGMRELLTRRCDLAIVGGVHASTPSPILLIFSQLNALSRRGHVRPFSKEADGTLLGEGVGFIVIKRREDAERDGDRIYAIVKALGVASDGRAVGLLSPRVEGEELALRRAYEMAGISPRSVELIEAHGTGTPVGDAAEIEALRRVFGAPDGTAPYCALGSVKSMICHSIPASGIAGIIKIALALYHKLLPPTLCDAPNPDLKLEGTPFYINTETRPWIHGDRSPRRAGVDAFGFGGINAHAILEEYVSPETEKPAYKLEWETEILIIEGGSRAELIREGERVRALLAGSATPQLRDLAWTLNSGLGDGACRLAIVATSPTDLDQKLAHAMQRLADQTCVRIRERSGIYFFERPLAREARLAFLFPGEGAQYPNMLLNLCLHFPEVRGWFDLIDRAFGSHHRNYRPSQIIFPAPGTDQGAQMLWQMDLGAEAVFTANQALLKLLLLLGIEPQAVLGHSTGEYSALLAAGAIRVENEEQLIQHVLDLNAIYERVAAAGQIPSGVLLTVSGVDRQQVADLVRQSPGPLYMAMDNCPSQIILCGTEVTGVWAREQLGRDGAICQLLPFGRAYHTPLFKPVRQALDEFYQRLKFVPPRIDTYSCAIARRYPQDPEEIRRLALSQWDLPVRFRETIEAMYEDGIQLFVEVGPRGNLTAFVDDILRGRPHLAVASDLPNVSGLTQLHHLLGLLAAHGSRLRLDALYTRRGTRHLDLDGAGAETSPRAAQHPFKLCMGLQPMSLSALGLARIRSTNDRAEGNPQLKRSPVGAQGPTLPMRPENVKDTTVGDRRTETMDSELPRQDSPRSLIFQEYLQAMERFLGVQESVMQAFLTGGAGSARGAGATVKAPGKTLDWQARPGPGIPTESLSESLPREGLPSPSPEPLVMTATHWESRPGLPDTLAADESGVRQALLSLVSEKTGYQPEMLDPTFNLEADLGIDSIKRMEILGAFQRVTGLLRAEDMEKVAALKTLQQIIDFVTPPTRRAGEIKPATEACGLASQVPFKGPFVGVVTHLLPGQEARVRRRLDLHDDLFLRHHTLGGAVSVSDENLLALPVVPLTISMEMVAEVTALLVPGKVVTGMRELRAYRWITLERGQVTLELAAKIKASTESAVEVNVQMHEVKEDEGTETARVGPVLVEATVLFGGGYPEAPPAKDLPLRGGRPSRWTPDRLYAEGMFHGPTLQGVTSVDRWGEDGAQATLSVLPREGLFRSTPDPVFLADPVLLDAVGQLVGYWAAEHLETGFNVFPYRLEALSLYGPALPVGTRMRCRARCALFGEHGVRSDFEVVGADGRLWARLTGWEDRRFELPSAFYRLRIAPRDATLGRPWLAPIAPFSSTKYLECCRIDGFSPEFFEAHTGIWQQVLAHLVLSRCEREVWRGLNGPPKRRTEWLLGRVAAKDAVRLYLKRRYGMAICPADVEITPDEYGCPAVTGSWVKDIGEVPALSIAHTDSVAVALVGDRATCSGVGVDVEPIGRMNELLRDVTFSPKERHLIPASSAPQQEEWSVRLWCAKEAVAKALGRGMVEGPKGLVIRDLDERTGRVTIALSGELAREFHDATSVPCTAYTVREGDLIVAVSLIENC